MNSYIDAQCKHMIAMIGTFEQACELATKRDDGIKSKEEEKTIKKIKAASEKFKAELKRASIP